MSETQQKTNQIKNVAVALVKDEEGRVLLIKPSDFIDDLGPSYTPDTPTQISKNSNQKKPVKKENWEFPSNTIVPGASYTETFSASVLEATGCIVEAISLVASEKHEKSLVHYEYVECKIICRDRPERGKKKSYKWVHPSRLRTHFRRRLHRDIVEFFSL